MTSDDDPKQCLGLSDPNLSADGDQVNLREVSCDLLRRLNPDSVSGGGALWPWSPERGARNAAKSASLEARLDIFRDDLRAIRIANEVLSRAATMRAVEAAETAIFEIPRAGIERYFRFYNQERLHQSLQYRRPAAICLAQA